MSTELKFMIHCGGSGTRLWPMSRKAKPKQFQSLVHKTSLFQDMVKQIEQSYSPLDIYPVTHERYVPIVRQQTPEIPVKNIITEPEARDTLACVGFATLVLSQRFKDPLVVNLWSDHYISSESEVLLKTLAKARKLAEYYPWIVKIDVKPTWPNLQLGYIEMGKQIPNEFNFELFEFVKQVEKPSMKVATRFIKSWRYLWHTGYFVARSSIVLSLYQKYANSTYKQLLKVVKAYELGDQKKVAELYKKLEKVSVDYGLYEKLPAGTQVELPAEMAWDDLGLWNVLKDTLVKSKSDNATQGLVQILNGKDNLVFAQPHKKVIVTDVDSLVIVDTKDALLVCAKDQASQIKTIVQQLEKEKSELI